MEAEMRTKRTKKTKTGCPYRAVECSFEVWTRDRHILKIEPTHGPANGISTCVKGKFAWGHINSDDRLTKPLLRAGESYREIEWEEPVDIIEKTFMKIKAEHVPDARAIIAPSK